MSQIALRKTLSIAAGGGFYNVMPGTAADCFKVMPHLQQNFVTSRFLCEVLILDFVLSHFYKHTNGYESQNHTRQYSIH